MSRTIQPEFKEYYHRELLPEYEAIWDQETWKLISWLHERIGCKENALERGLRSMLVRNFKTRSIARHKAGSLSTLLGIRPMSVGRFFEGHDQIFRVTYYTPPRDNGTVFCIENTILGNAYAAFLLGETMNGFTTRAMHKGHGDGGGLRRPMHGDVLWSAIPLHGSVRLNFEFKPDGDRYESTIRL